MALHLFTSAAISVSRDPGDPALAAVAASVNLTPDAIVQVHQVHGREVLWLPRINPISGINSWQPQKTADVLVTDDPGQAVGVRVADCAPILMADRHGRGVAAVHAGWRGTAARAAQAGVEALRTRVGIDPADLIVSIGPSIRSCCYEVGPEVRDHFAAAGHDEAALERWFSKGMRDRWQLDVPRANHDQLEASGVPAAQIFDSSLCTACHAATFHSYRRNVAGAGRMMGVIRPRPS